MHKYIILFFSVTLFLCACTGSSVPAKVIPPKKMVALLTGLHIIDGILYDGKLSPDSAYKYGTARYIALFKKFGTDSAEFKKSMQYYTSNIDKLSAIYDEVDDRLKDITDSVTKAQMHHDMRDHGHDDGGAREERKRDSMRMMGARRHMMQGMGARKLDSLQTIKRK